MKDEQQNIDALIDEAGILIDADPKRAIVLSTELYEQCVENRYQRGQAAALRCIGACHLHLSNSDKGVACLTQAWQISVAVKDRLLEARCINGLGMAAHLCSKFEEAIQYYLRALSIFEEVGEEARGAVTLNNIGAAFQSLGDHDTALHYLEKALEVTRRSTESGLITMPLQNIAIICHATGNTQRALDCLHEALTSAEQAGSARNIATTLALFSLAYLTEDRIAEAEEYANRALDMALQLGLRTTEAEAMCLVARIQARRSDLSDAIRLFEQALDIIESTGNESQMAESLVEFGNLLLQAGDFDAARSCWERAYRIAEKIRVTKAIGTAHLRLAGVCKLKGDFYNACRHLEIAQTVERLVFTQQSSAREKALLLQMDLDRSRREAELILIEAEHRRKEVELRQEHMDALQALNEELRLANLSLEASNARLAQLASTDLLTGLNNRRYCQSKLNEGFESARCYDSPFSVLLLDVDRFKSINDTYGHAAGDQVLINIGELLAATVRCEATAARWGGEEFLIVLPNAAERDALIVAERIRAAIESGRCAASPVTVSIGAATLAEDVLSPDDLVHRADRALLYSKSHGRNRVTHFLDLTPHEV